MATRKLGPQRQDELRTKIEAQKLIARLQDHVLGKVELSASQVSAARTLLNKALSNAPAQVEAVPGGELSEMLRSILNAAKSRGGVAGLVGAGRKV